MFRLLVLALAVCVSASSFGFGQVSARVLSVRIDQDGRGMVLFDQPVSGEPATCRDSAYANALAFDANTPGGKALMDLALASKANGFAMYAVGLGTCNIFGGNVAEDWDYGVMQ